LLKAKFKMLKIIIVFHCFPLGKGSFQENNLHTVVHLLIGGYLLVAVLACVYSFLGAIKWFPKNNKHNATIAKTIGILWSR
jgi:hypothetical protein